MPGWQNIGTTPVEILSVTVPAGSYLLIASVTAALNDDDPQSLSCSFGSITGFTQAPFNEESENVSILGWVSNVAANTSISLMCSGHNRLITDATLTALQINSVTYIPE